MARNSRALPDSLIEVRYRLENLLLDMQRCERDIVTPGDYSRYKYRIEQLRDTKDAIRSQYPVSEHDELWSYISGFSECEERIEQKIAEWLKEEESYEVIEKMILFSRSFDSLYAKGSDYSVRKSVDSLRSVKKRAEDKWSEIGELKTKSGDIFEQDSVKALYKRIGKTKDKIQDLPEKEKMKVREILLVVAAIIAAVTMIITLIRSIMMTKKSKETPSIEI